MELDNVNAPSLTTMWSAQNYLNRLIAYADARIDVKFGFPQSKARDIAAHLIAAHEQLVAAQAQFNTAQSEAQNAVIRIDYSRSDAGRLYYSRSDARAAVAFTEAPTYYLRTLAANLDAARLEAAQTQAAANRALADHVVARAQHDKAWLADAQFASEATKRAIDISEKRDGACVYQTAMDRLYTVYSIEYFKEVVQIHWERVPLLPKDVIDAWQKIRDVSHKTGDHAFKLACVARAATLAAKVAAKKVAALTAIEADRRAIVARQPAVVAARAALRAANALTLKNYWSA